MEGKQKQAFLLVFLICISNCGFINPGDPTIISVSTSLDSVVAPTGSLMGGTYLYIKGTNFSPDADENTVTVGPYACPIVANGAKVDTLTCQTTAATNSSYLYSLTVAVTVNTVIVSCNSNNCAFSYTTARTPYVEEIIPRSVVGGDSVYVFGTHRITDLGDGRSSGQGEIRYFSIGDHVCSLIDVVQDQDSYSSTSRSAIECTSDSAQEAGEYDFTELVFPGLARQSQRLIQTSYFTGEDYTQRVVPQITQISSQVGGSFGQSLIVYGTGFSTDVDDYTCTIAGEECTVTAAGKTQLTVEVPATSTNNTDFGVLTQDANDSSTRTGTFLGAGGLNYKRYDRNSLSKTGSAWLTYLRGTPTIQLLQQKTITELSVGQVYGSNHVDYVTGYFHAPVDGVYRFSAIADDYFYMAMSSVQNNSNPANLQALLEHPNYNYYHYISYARANQSATVANKTLTAGYYYIEAVCVDYGSTSFFKVMVDFPNFQNQTSNPTWQIDRVIIQPSAFVAQTIDVIVYGASGTFDLYYYDSSSTLNLASIAIGASASTFYNALYYLPNIYNYGPTVTRTLLDSTGAVTTSTVYGYKYTITLNRYRGYISPPSIRVTNVVSSANKTKSGTSTRTSVHSAPLSGTFLMYVGGTALSYSSTTSLAYNIDPYGIQTALNAYYGVSQIKVNRVMGTAAVDSIQFVIEYVGLTQAASAITLTTSTLAGGATDATIVSTIQTLRYYSYDRAFYSPIPYDFLNTVAELPQLSLTINSIPAVCEDCSYQFQAQATPILLSASRSSSTFTLSVSDPSALNFTISDISVTFLGTDCLSLSGTIASFTCTLVVNSDSTPALPAGTGVPIVHVIGIGYANNTLIAEQTIPLTVTSVSPTVTSPGGGIQGTLVGTGFPVSQDQDDTNDLAIYICGNQVIEYSSISNLQIVFTVPTQQVQCTSNNTYISFNQQSQTFTFTYDASVAPQITALSKTSSSPILKSSLIVTGSNFGNITSTTVWLAASNGTKIYQLNVANITNTTIGVVLGGGISGEYDVVVVHSVYGQSTPGNYSTFTYKIVVTGLSISSGQKGGGYNLTIYGQNFATASGTNYVFIGDASNSLCEILTNSQTQITCTVPRMLSDYTTNTSLDVVVTGRLTQQSVCQGNCTFTYLDDNTPTITLPSSLVYASGDNVTVTGEGLSNAVITINDVVATIVSNNDTNLVFTYPALPAGSYQVLILVAQGWTYPQFVSKTVLAITSTSSSTTSFRGRKLTVKGNGFPAKAKNVNIWFICSSNNTLLTVQSYTPTTLNVQIPPYVNKLSCSLNVTIGTTFSVFVVTYSASYTASLTYTNSDLTFTFAKVNMTTLFTINSVQLVWLDSSSNPTTSVYTLTVSGLTATATYLPAGTFKILAHSTTYGYAYLATSTYTRTFSTTPSVSASVSSSFAGGQELTILGAGFITTNIQNNQIAVCGIKASIVSATATQAVIQIPPLLTTVTQQLYELADQDADITAYATPFGDSTTSTYTTDGSFNTIYSSSNSVCYVGLNFGSQVYADITRIRFVPNPAWATVVNYLQDGVFQGSNDGTTYTQIFQIDTNTVHSGWNTWYASQNSTVAQYQYVRFRHTSVSGCKLAQIQVYGTVYSTTTVSNTTDKTCNITINNNNYTVVDAVVYSHASTSVVTAVQPQFAPSVGGTVLLITGTNFGSNITVYIDQIQCVLLNSSATQIYCTTGVRASPPQDGNSFVITSDNNPSKISCDPFLYIDRWSSSNTWGGEAVPRAGDSVYVPVGMTLLVDQSTPILNAVIVQGKIKFQDEQDITFDAGYIIMNGGQFQAGTQDDRFEHDLTITLHGNIYKKQLPTFGNKVIGCRNCKFNMHGIQRQVTWTELNATISIGDTSFTVITPVDWVVGDKIAVASSSFDHYESQQRTISAISSDNLTITVSQAFDYKHLAVIQTYGTTQLVMRAQVGLLTRNIVVKGDDDSQDLLYGSHLMFTGSQTNGLQAKLSYTQFTKCGQPRIVGRYCTHFHMAGQVPNSYVKGISVHDSMARVLTIHGSHYVTVENSVGFRVQGHNIFIQDGIQTNNVIQDNLMISSITSNIMLQSDITVASYWITNPYNTVRRNHAAGGDFYGFWYQIKSHPDGPSATMDICPQGMQVGVSQDNVAHSNRRFGLRIFKLSARQYPCQDTFDQSLVDVYSSNPAIHSLFDNYTLWKNEECGFLGEQLGYTTINDFKTADSRKGGLQFHKTNYTKQLVIAQNSIVVGYTASNAPTDIDTTYQDARGVIAARTDGLKFSGIQFYNFGATMTPLQSCSECWNMKIWVTGGKTTYFENITYTNILGNYIYWQVWRREIFVDLDGTLTQPYVNLISPSIANQTSGYITPYRPSLQIPDHCYTINNTDLWNKSIFCDADTTLRSILFTNAIPVVNFNAIQIKAHYLQTAYQNFTSTNATYDSFSNQTMIIIKKSHDKLNSWAMPFAVNNYYNIHWKWGIDFTHVAIAPSRLWNESEGVVLRFNYSEYRQFYQIGKWYQQALQLPYITASDALITPTTCYNGDYYHDMDAKYLFVCVSGRNKTIREWIDVNGIKCLNFCPTDDDDDTRETFFRLWSNVSQWTNNTLPVAGENVTIPYAWNLVMDVDPPILNYLLVNGILIFDRTRANNTLQAHYIWVKKGIIRIGTEDSPFNTSANIILYGSKDSDSLVIDADAAGNKILAVTGGLQFYGIEPDTAWTRLTQIATVNATTIKVASVSGWSVGDEIVIAPTYTGPKQFEQVTITAISGKTVTFTPALSYEHYGASDVTIQNTYGTLDTRAAVGLLTRNIKISSSADTNGWKGRILVYGYSEQSQDLTQAPVWRNGYAKLHGVQIDGLSQYDTEYAAITFRNLGLDDNTNQQTSQVENTAIHGCGGWCIYIDDVQNLYINNNVIFWARKFLVYVQDIISDYTFTNNLLIGARKRDEVDTTASMMVDDVACYEQYVPIDFAGDIGVNVSYNLAQGSQGEGFVLPSTPCAYYDSYPFMYNTAGSCIVAFMYERVIGQTCLAMRGAIGYASEIGLMANMAGSHTRMIYADMFFADNQRGITLRYAHQIDDNTVIFKNSYITGVSRPSCTSCYSDTTITYCQGGYAVRMFAATISGQSFPLKKKNTGHDVICTQESFDAKAFVDNVTFANYYYSNTNLTYCSGMSVFKRHNLASDGTASHHLTNTYCINCSVQSWAYFDKPLSAWRGWFGGCGTLDCTGPNNYIIDDQDGTFTGTKSQLLANNTWVGDNEAQCTYYSAINGHWCINSDLAVLEYESIAPDYNTRIMWPVYLKYDGGSWNSTTNGWREWEWDGAQPLNLRLARFWSTIKLAQSYNLTYSSQPPSDSRFQIQRRLQPYGNASDWAVIRIFFPLPNSIQVLVKNTTGSNIVVKPYVIKNGVSEDLTTHTTICGANNFYYTNGTIQFVVNGINNCQVRVRLSSYIQLTARLSISISDFYTNDGLTTFITNICAFLGIDTGRMKIVSVKSGSVVINSVIQTTASTVDASGNTTANSTTASATLAELTALASKLSSGISTVDLGATLLSSSTSTYVFNDDGSVYTETEETTTTESTNKALIIALAVVIPIVIVVLGAAGYCYWKRKRAQIHESGDAVNDKSTANREHVKGITEFELSAVDEYNTSIKYNNKKWSDAQV